MGKEQQNNKSGKSSRTFRNPLLAEAVAEAKRQLLSEPEEANPPQSPQDQEPSQPEKTRSRWADDEDDDEEAPAAATKKRRHTTVNWQEEEEEPEATKAQRTKKGITAGMSMADRAAAELEEFRRRQAELTTEEGFVAASPEISSPEEEMHIRREGNSAHDLRRGLESELESPPTGPRRNNNKDDEEKKEKKSAATGILDDLDDLSDDDGNALIPIAEKEEEEEEEEEEEKIEDEAQEEPALGPSRPPPPSLDEVYAYPEAVNDEEEEHVAAYPEPPPLSEEEEEQVEEEDSFLLKRQVSMLNECRSVENYEKLNRISEGTYGVVYRARDLQTGKICALKKVKLEKERDGFPLTSVREINVLLSLQHPSIVNVSEVVVGNSLDSVFMVMEYADHDLKGVMEKRMTQAFTIAEVKCLMQQLLSGVAYLHGHWVIHRDLKTSNILYTNRGQLKICDFGLARQYGEPLKPYTQLVVTLWYRSPELLLGARTYSTAVDVWSCGCIMAELLRKKPLFAAQNEISQLDAIFRVLGKPTPEAWPGVDRLPNFRKFNFKGSERSTLREVFPRPGPVFDGRPTLSDCGFDLLSGLLELCPEKRLSAEAALNHPWFSEHPLPKDPAMMPTFPETNSVKLAGR